MDPLQKNKNIVRDCIGPTLRSLHGTFFEIHSYLPGVGLRVVWQVTGGSWDLVNKVLGTFVGAYVIINVLTLCLTLDTTSCGAPFTKILDHRVNGRM